ncbi:calcium-binding protein [Azospirillum doebereinerae]
MSSYADAADMAFDSFTADLGGNLVGDGLGTLGALAVGKLLDAVGLDGLAGGLVGTVANVVLVNPAVNALMVELGLTEATQTVSGSVIGNIEGVFTGLDGAFSMANLLNAGGGFLGSQLAGMIVPAQTQAGAAIGAVGGVAGASIMAYSAWGQALIPIPGVGVLIGAFVGTVLGTVFGNLIGNPSVGPNAQAVVAYDAATGDYGVIAAAADNGGDAGVARNMGDAVAQTLNLLLEEAGGALAGPVDARAFGYFKGEYYNDLEGDYQGLANYGNPETAIVDGVLKMFHQLILSDADAGILQALDATKATTLAELYADVAIAKDYAFYLDNQDAIASAVRAAPDSSFAAGWALTLTQALALGLDKVPGALAGGAGDDVLTGADGSDTLRGGAGIDTASYAGSKSGVTVSLATGTGQGGDAEGDRLGGIENLTGSAFADHLTGDGGANRLVGGAGNDTLVGGGGVDTLPGADGDDLLVGDLDDSVRGGAGYDRLVLVTQGGGVVADANRWTDVEAVTGTESDDQLSLGNGGVAAGPALEGGGGNDRLGGSVGANQLGGGAGADRMLGAGGDDTYVFRRGDGADEILDAWQQTYLDVGAEHLVADGRDSGCDTLVFGPGIAPSDLLLLRQGDTLLIGLRDPGNSGTPFEALPDRLVVRDYFQADSRIENFVFADGTRTTAEAIGVGAYVATAAEQYSDHVVAAERANDGADRIAGAFATGPAPEESAERAALRAVDIGGPSMAPDAALLAASMAAAAFAPVEGVERSWGLEAERPDIVATAPGRAEQWGVTGGIPAADDAVPPPLDEPAVQPEHSWGVTGNGGEAASDVVHDTDAAPIAAAGPGRRSGGCGCESDRRAGRRRLADRHHDSRRHGRRLGTRHRRLFRVGSRPAHRPDAHLAGGRNQRLGRGRRGRASHRDRVCCRLPFRRCACGRRERQSPERWRRRRYPRRQRRKRHVGRRRRRRQA